MCLTVRELNTILRMLATLPVGCRRPSHRSIKGFIPLVSSPSCPLYGGTGGGHPRVCWIYDQSANPLSFCHHNFNDLAELPIKRSWLCTFIISWQRLPKAITTQLKNLKQLEHHKVFQALSHFYLKLSKTKLEMCQAPSYGFAVPFFLPKRAQAFYLI